MMKDGVSLGNKAGYSTTANVREAWLRLSHHRHGATRRDRGEHHGTYSKGKWWWVSRGYTPAGVEAWDGIRGLDYLVSRPDVDPERLGVTGRSGGGAYSWWIAALDERVKVAAPTAGITTLRNHVIDGAIEGHCDCMFFVNTYRWDYEEGRGPSHTARPADLQHGQGRNFPNRWRRGRLFQRAPALQGRRRGENRASDFRRSAQGHAAAQ